MCEQVFHGGGLAKALQLYGGEKADWLDLSTAINPVPVAVPDIDFQHYCALPDDDLEAQAAQAARIFYNVPDDCAVLPIAGIQDVIAVLPLLRPTGSAAIFRHGYGEYQASFLATDWRVDITHDFAELAKSDLAIVINPNNPDANTLPVQNLVGLAQKQSGKNGLLILDEAFGDLGFSSSMISHANKRGVIVLKSFGKFFGLAGIRLGFAIGYHDEIAALRRRIGPWSVSGPALAMGADIMMLPDIGKQVRDNIAEMSDKQLTLYDLANVKVEANAGLFHLLDVSDAAHVQDQLCQKHQILTRCFDYSKTWLRLGLCANEAQRARLKTALKDVCGG